MDRNERVKRLKKAGSEKIVKVVKGDKGDPGQDAKDNYQLWLDDGNEGTIDDFLATLKGERGEPGKETKEVIVEKPIIKKKTIIKRFVGEKGEPGRPGIVWRAAWEDNVEYHYGDAVSSFGSAYICIKDHTSNVRTRPPIGTLYKSVWAILAEKGEQGAAGAPGASGQNASGGAGAVDSVNSKTGVVVLTTADIADSANKRYVTDAKLVVLTNTSGVNTGDQDLSGLQPKDTDLTAIAALDSSTSGAIASDGAGWIKKTYAQLKTALGLVQADVGLGNVDNTSDTTKNAASVTLTNKRITRRIGTVASSGTPTINTDNVDQFNITALVADITSFTTNLSGSPNDGDELIIRIKSAAVQNLTFGASFRGSLDTALPATTSGSSLTDYIKFRYNAADSLWDITALSMGY